MRNIKIKLISTVVASIAVSNAFASTPYIGIEAIQTNQNYKQGYGEKVFKKNTQSYGLFTGFMFSRYFGMELGYEMQPKRNKDVTLVAGDSLPGEAALTGANTSTIQSSIRQSHPYIGLFGECRVKKTKYDAMIGASISHVKAQHSSYPSGANQRNYSKTKVVPMVKLSATHSVTKCVGVRFSLNYRNMQAFKIYSSQTNNNQLRMRDSFGVGLGVTYSFK